MRASDAETIVTPGKIYHALGKRANCGGCMKLFVATMRAADGFVVDADPRLVLAVLRGLRQRAAV